MFKIFFLHLILVLLYSGTMSSKITTTPLNMDFNGVVISGTNIVAYSDKGAILITTDRGNSWEQKSIYDYGSIQCLIDKDDALWGVMDIGVIIKSTDHGVNWTTHRIGLDKGDSCKYLAVSDDNIFVRTKDRIVQYDKDYMYLNEYKNSLLETKRFEMSGFDEWIEPFLFMAFINGKLLVSVGKETYNGNGYIYSFDEDLNLLNIIDIYKYLPGFSLNRYTDFSGFELKNVFSYNDQTVFIIKHLPFIVSDDLSEWSYLFDDHTIGKKDNPNSDNVVFLQNYLNNDTFYCGHSDTNPEYSWIVGYGSGSIKIQTIGIRKFINDSLELQNNLFDNSYYCSKSWGPGAKISNIYYSLIDNDFIVLDDSIVVWRGFNKTLLQSQDLGKEWELISHFSNHKEPKLIINDSIFYFFDLISKQISRTNNGGQTFLPVKIDSNEHIPYFQDFGYGPFLFYIDSNGKGLFTGPFPFGINYPEIPELAYTEDFGRTFRFIHKDNIGINKAISFCNVVDKQSKLIVAVNYENDDSCRVVSFTKNNYEFELISTDTTMTIHHILAEDLSHFYAFAKVKATNEKQYESFEVKETTDGSLSWNTLCTIDRPVDAKYFYTHNQDSVFMTALNPNRIYLYDRNRNEIDTLFIDDENKYKFLQLVCISDQFFIFGDSLLLENTNRQDLTEWQPMEWDYGTPHFKQCLFKGNIALVEMEDDKRTPGHYKITLDRTSKVEEQTENNEIAHFYAARPYPLPAKNTVRSKVFWDSDYRIENAWIRVYGILGQEVSTKDKIKVENIESYSAEVVWDCSQMNPGIYFIVLDYHGQTKTIPVVVGR